MSRHNKFAEDSAVLSVVIPEDMKSLMSVIADSTNQSLSSVARCCMTVGLNKLLATKTKDYNEKK